MTPVKPRRLIRSLTLAEAVAAVWSALSALSVGVVVPLVVLPKVAEVVAEGVLVGDHVQRVLNPWLGHFSGAFAGTVLLAALFWPMRQELGRLLLLLSLVMSLSIAFYTSWSLHGVLG